MDENADSRVSSRGPDDSLYEVIPPAPGTEPSRWVLPPAIAKVVPEDEYEEPRESSPPLQFTLADLFIVTTGAAVILSIVVTMRSFLPVAAGAASIGALVGAIILLHVEPESKAVRMGCWGVLSFYVVACLVAITMGRP